MIPFEDKDNGNVVQGQRKKQQKHHFSCIQKDDTEKPVERKIHGQRKQRTEQKEKTVEDTRVRKDPENLVDDFQFW